MSVTTLLNPSEVAVLANASKTIVEKALEQKVLHSLSDTPRNNRLLPLHAVALTATIKSVGRRLSVSDKRLVERELARLSPADLKTAEIEVAPSIFVHVGSLTHDAVERAERYAAAREAFIELADGVQGGRPVIKGTRLTVSAIYDRLSAGDTIEELIKDYPDVPQEAFEAAHIYGETHPQLGRPMERRVSRKR